MIPVLFCLFEFSFYVDDMKTTVIVISLCYELLEAKKQYFFLYTFLNVIQYCYSKLRHILSDQSGLFHSRFA